MEMTVTDWHRSTCQRTVGNPKKMQLWKSKTVGDKKKLLAVWSLRFL